MGKTLPADVLDSVRRYVRRKIDQDFEGGQRAAAAAWGMSQSQISYFLAGKGGLGLNGITRIAAYYGVPADDLMGGGEPGTSYELPPEAGPYEQVESSALYRRSHPDVQRAYRERRFRLPSDPSLALEKATRHLLSLIEDHRNGVLDIEATPLLAAERKPEVTPDMLRALAEQLEAKGRGKP